MSFRSRRPSTSSGYNGEISRIVEVGEKNSFLKKLFDFLPYINYFIQKILKGLLLGETKLLEKVSTEIKARHYSLRTEKTYISWIQPVRYSEVSLLFCKVILSHGIKTTMIYTHIANLGAGVRSPLDG